MKMNWITFTLAAAVTVGGVMTSWAGESPAGRGRSGGFTMARAVEELGLTQDQIADIKAALADEKDNAVKLLSRLREARKGLSEAIHNADGTERSVRAAAKKVAEVEADLAVQRFKVYGKFNPILTEEQREKIKQLEERMDGFMDGIVKRMSERPGE